MPSAPERASQASPPRSNRSRIVALAIVGCGLSVASAFAQNAPVPAAQVPAAPAATAGWQDGFFIQSADGASRIQIGVFAQFEGRFTTDDPSAFTNTLAIRKARPTLQGRVARYFEFKLTPDFGNGAATVVDAYLDTRFSSAFRVRFGKDKTPIGLELLYADQGLLFAERSLASSLVPNRDLGVQVLGDVAGGRVSYALGVFNGVVDGANSTTDLDTGNGKDIAGRVFIQPFSTARLGFHLGASTGSQTGSLPSFKTSAGQTYFAYSGASADGNRVRVAPGVSYYYRHVGGFAEYARTTQDVGKTGITRSVTNDGWDVTGTWILTGETATTGVIRPKVAFDPTAGHWGAVQIVARYSQLDIDQAAFDAGFAASGASRAAKQFAIGADWYPVQFVKYYLCYERTSFDGDAPRPAEHAILLRTQLFF